LLQVASTTLIVNLRHVFYALSFPLGRVHGLPAKVYSPSH
jgi:predicted branched-subunit amino acid permease